LQDELNAILKFGAEELFKDEGENEGGEDNCDIDEILRRAETHEEAARPGDDLLSAFKVATFNVNEDDLPEVTSNSAAAEGTGEPKDWDQIIPEDIRKKVEAQEKEKEMADLYLPPRSSRNAAGNADVKPALGNEALNRKYRNQKRKRGEKASEEELSESDDDGRPTRKRGRPKHGKDPKYTDIQVRKFLKSLKKFASPLNRIDKVAEDCGMTDKPIAELKKLAQELLDGCQVCTNYGLHTTLIL
jgi:chromodomain-helicase-DNA-binding protein 1